MMMTFVSKLPVKTMTLKQFHELVSFVYPVSDFPNQPVTMISQGYILMKENILAYHIEEDSMCDLIFDQSQSELYLGFESKKNAPFQFLDLLFHRQLIEKDNELMIQEKPHFYKTEQIPQLNHLPYLLFKKGAVKQEMIETCASLLKGMVHVVSVEGKTYAPIYVNLFNQDLMRFSQYKNESDASFIQRIVVKIQNYMSKRVFEMPFNMNELYQQCLFSAIETSKSQEEAMLEYYDKKLNVLENDKQKLIAHIEAMSSQIELLHYQIEEIEERLKKNNQYPILFKGSEPEKYPGEQKDMILDIIRDELKIERDPLKVQLLNEIVNENPAVGKRKEMLEEIYRILISCSQLTERQFVELARVGVYLEKKSTKHIYGDFFQDTRYKQPVSSTSSDVNVGHQIYRTVRNLFF